MTTAGKNHNLPEKSSWNYKRKSNLTIFVEKRLQKSWTAKIRGLEELFFLVLALFVIVVLLGPRNENWNGSERKRHINSVVKVSKQSKLINTYKNVISSITCLQKARISYEKVQVKEKMESGLTVKHTIIKYCWRMDSFQNQPVYRVVKQSSYWPPHLKVVNVLKA